jgi:flagellar hook-length control protein FliK
MTAVATAADLASVAPPAPASSDLSADPSAGSTGSGSGSGFTDALDAAASGAAPPVAAITASAPAAPASPTSPGMLSDAPMPAGYTDAGPVPGAPSGHRDHEDHPTNAESTAHHDKATPTPLSPETGGMKPAATIAAAAPGDGSGAGSSTAPARRDESGTTSDREPGAGAVGLAEEEAESTTAESASVVQPDASSAAGLSGGDKGRGAVHSAPGGAAPPAPGTAAVRSLLSTERQQDGDTPSAAAQTGHIVPDPSATATSATASGSGTAAARPHDASPGASLSSAAAPVAAPSAPAAPSATAQAAAAATPSDDAEVSLPDQVVSILAPLQAGADGTHEVTLGLTPDGLGSVQATVVVGPQQVVVSLWADSQTGHTALAQTLSQLNSQLSEDSNRRVTVNLANFGSAQPETSGGTGGRGDRGDARRSGQSATIGTIDYSPAPMTPVLGGGAQMVDLRL